jgi:hypothetical protein
MKSKRTRFFSCNCRAVILAAGFEIGGEDRRLQFSYLINMDFSSVIARGCEETPRIALSPREREDRAEDGLLSDL